MLRNSLVFVLLLLALGTATYFTGGEHALMGSPIPEKEESGSFITAPDFSFKTLQGQPKKLSDFDGKVVVLNFWASWCAPCIIEFPQLLTLAEQQKNKMVLLAISLDEDPKALKRFLAQMKKTNASSVIIGRDQDKKISRDLFQTVKLPETFLITPNRKIAEKIIGASVRFDSPEMLQKIDELYRIQD